MSVTRVNNKQRFGRSRFVDNIVTEVKIVQGAIGTTVQIFDGSQLVAAYVILGRIGEPPPPKTVPTVPPAPKPLKVMRVLLDPGHSEGEPGARSNDGSAEEEDLARLQASIIQKELQTAGHVCDIYDPKVDDLSDIGRKADGYDLFLSLHFNSYDGNRDPGTEVFVLPGADATNRKFATAILNSIVGALGSTNRGVKEANWQVIRVADQYCKGPALLIESFFLNSYSAGAAMQRATLAGGAIATAVLRLFA